MKVDDDILDAALLCLSKFRVSNDHIWHIIVAEEIQKERDRLKGKSHEKTDRH